MAATTALRECRLIVDAPLDGAWNMAVDEALRESAARDGLATLRFYQWGDPTLSLGYFQEFAARQLHRPSRDCTVVRRESGGGAILHDRGELTYCLAVPLAHPLAHDPGRLYRAAHDGLVEYLASRGVMTEIALAEVPEGPKGPFLCFQKMTPGDVLVGGNKVCGSAQRRRQGAIQQHGSLLIEGSPQAPELPGLAELTGTPWSHSEVAQAWGDEMAARLSLRLILGELAQSELARVRSLTLEKYGSNRWTQKR